MKTITGIFAGLFFGFASLAAMAYECPPWMTDDNCERAKEEAEGKSAAVKAPTQIAYHGYSRPQGSGNTGPRLTRYWTEERDDGKYFCKEYSNGKVDCTHIPHSASAGESTGKTQIASLRIDNPNGDACETSDAYACFGDTDQSPVVKDIIQQPVAFFCYFMNNCHR